LTIHPSRYIITVMSLLGKRLREERESRGLALLQVELDTRIRANVIQALEDGELENLPPEPFLRGLIRSYANYLRIDPQEMLDLYAADTVATAPPPPRTPFVRHPAAAPHAPSARPPDPNTTAEPPPFENMPEAQVAPPRAERMAPSPSPSSMPEPVARRRLPLAPPSPKPKKPVLPIRKAPPPPSLPPETLPPPEKLATDPAAITEAVLLPIDDAKTAPVQEPLPEIKDEFKPPASEGVPGERPQIPRATIIFGGVALLFGLLACVFFASTRVGPLYSAFVAQQSTATPTRIPRTATPTPVPGATFTGVPTIAATAPPFATLPGNPTPSPTPKVTPRVTLEAGTGSMNLDIAATQPMTIQIGTDGLMAFDGPLAAGTTQTWSAKESVYLRVQNLAGGTVTFNNKKQLPLNYSERSLFVRQWIVNPSGKVIGVTPVAPTGSLLAPSILGGPTTVPATSSAAGPTPAFSRTATPTRAAPSTSAPTPTRTPPHTATPTPTSTVMPLPTNTATPRVPTATLTPFS
jgi:cytoskeleton protein RodZ